MYRTRVPALLVHAFFLVILLTASGAALAMASPGARADFDGDGYGDLALGAPLDSVSGHENAGAVNVIYGSRAGLRTRGDQQFTQDSSGVKAFASADDLFGTALAAGDLNGDGHDDLAIGAPGEDVNGRRDAGVVQVLYGSAGGLSTVGDDLVHQGLGSVKGGDESFDRFGAAVAIGHFRGWQSASLAIGAPGDGIAGRRDAGAVNVLRGGRSGLHRSDDQMWTRNSAGVPGRAADGDLFGTALAAGDLSRSGRDELVIGAPGRDALRTEGPVSGPGTVTILYGSGGGRGLTARAAQLWWQGKAGIKGAPSHGDGFGAAVTVGDLDGDGDSDLAVGAPYDSVGGAANAGAVSIIRGSNTGLHSGADQIWTQDSAGIQGGASEDDLFGFALVAADFSRNGVDDLAVGVRGESKWGREDSGLAHILFGRPGSGLGRWDDFWHQGRSGVEGWLEEGDQLAWSLTAGDFDDDGDADLAASVPYEAYGGIIAAGAVNVLNGGEAGVHAHGNRLFTQGTAGIDGTPGQDLFGAGLGAVRP